MKKFRLWLLKRKFNKVQYELAWLELQYNFKRMGLGCYTYLWEKNHKKFDKICEKMVALEK